jgi:hypothetical protein
MFAVRRLLIVIYWATALTAVVFVTSKHSVDPNRRNTIVGVALRWFWCFLVLDLMMIWLLMAVVVLVLVGGGDVDVCLLFLLDLECCRDFICCFGVCPLVVSFFVIIIFSSYFIESREVTHERTNYSYVNVVTKGGGLEKRVGN